MDEGRRAVGWLLPAVGVAAVVVLVVIGLNREPEQFEPDTPEGTVQAYIEALVDGDFEAASDLWAEGGCLPASSEPTLGAPDVSASLVRVEDFERDANVIILITENAADPVTGGGQYEEWFSLVREEEGWRIVQPSWPYYDQRCEET